MRLGLASPRVVVRQIERHRRYCHSPRFDLGDIQHIVDQFQQVRRVTPQRLEHLVRLRAGASGFVLKDDPAEQLIAAVERLVEAIERVGDPVQGCLVTVNGNRLPQRKRRTAPTPSASPGTSGRTSRTYGHHCGHCSASVSDCQTAQPSLAVGSRDYRRGASVSEG